MALARCPHCNGFLPANLVACPQCTSTPGKLLRWGLQLEYFTLGWNVIGAVIVIFAAVEARSVALAGFGLDSLIEIGASMVVIWQLMNIHNRQRERRAMRMIALAFFALVAYILVQSAHTPLLQSHPNTSVLGIEWLALTLIVMLLLAGGKRRIGTLLDHSVLKTEARVTLVDAYLAGSVLVGRLLNEAFGWWWADPLAGLVIVFNGVAEGRHVRKEASA